VGFEYPTQSKSRPFPSSCIFQKSPLKRDHPVFFSSRPVIIPVNEKNKVHPENPGKPTTRPGFKPVLKGFKVI
jgi:hypothetical protein